MLNKYLDINPEVAEALANGKPVVALESTIISHGMPYPQNVETALTVQNIIRENGAVPATIGIIGGRLKAGMTDEEIEYFGKKGAQKVYDRLGFPSTLLPSRDMCRWLGPDPACLGSCPQPQLRGFFLISLLSNILNPLIFLMDNQ